MGRGSVQVKLTMSLKTTKKEKIMDQPTDIHLLFYVSTQFISTPVHYLGELDLLFEAPPYLSEIKFKTHIMNFKNLYAVSILLFRYLYSNPFIVLKSTRKDVNDPNEENNWVNILKLGRVKGRRKILFPEVIFHFRKQNQNFELELELEFDHILEKRLLHFMSFIKYMFFAPSYHFFLSKN